MSLWELLRYSGAALRDLDLQIDRLVFQGPNSYIRCPNCSYESISEGVLYPGIGCGQCQWRVLYSNGSITPHYSADIMQAWTVRNHIVEQIFSIRVCFKRALQYTISRRVCNSDNFFLVHPGEILLLVTPEDICRAALEVYTNKEVYLHDNWIAKAMARSKQQEA